MTLNHFNQLEKEAAKAQLMKCCGSTQWAEKMLSQMPFSSKESMLETAEKLWHQCTEKDWLEAFTHHPKIGDLKSLTKKFASTKNWTSKEQASVHQAQPETLQALAQGNEDYEKKFGYIFIVCATGKSADEMLALLQARLPNEAGEEIKIAMGEQDKITKIRIEKLLKMSQITTHILDTSKGSPAQGVKIKLQKPKGVFWDTIAEGVTNEDGRIASLLEGGQTLEPGIYRMHFETVDYFQQQDLKSFYPEVNIIFETFDTEHYHVPLLLNPFGYSTYRGS